MMKLILIHPQLCQTKYLPTSSLDKPCWYPEKLPKQSETCLKMNLYFSDLHIGYLVNLNSEQLHIKKEPE